MTQESDTTPTDTTPTSELSFEHGPLVRLLISTAALRDELDHTLGHADLLHDRAEALARALLAGHPAPTAPMLAQAQRTAQTLGRVTRWIGSAEQSLSALGPEPLPSPIALPSPVVEGLLGLIDALALLTPWASTGRAPSRHLRAPRACVEQVLGAALRGPPLRPALAALAEQHARLLALGGPAQAGAQRLGESLTELLHRQG